MSESLGVAFITIGGLVSMGAIAFFFIKTMFYTANYENKKNNNNNNL